VNNVPEAKAPNGGYFYLLKATRVIETYGWNAFKVRSSGFVSTGASSLTNSTFGLVASFGGVADTIYYFPNIGFTAKGAFDFTNLGSSPYNGDWNFSFFIPNKTVRLEVWDGDFDRGANKVDISADTKDPNSPSKPEWATPSTVEERAGGMGIPADNHVSPIFRRGVPVIFQVMDPTGNPIYVNENPSGTEEWERFVVSTIPDDPDADLLTHAIEPGFYNMSIQGLDVANAVYLRTNFAICDPDEGCGFTPWVEAACPRTIGYWKNNFKKVQAALPKTSGDNTPKGAQESQNSLLYGLNIVSQSSKIFRSELVSGTTVNVSDLSGSAATPLTMDQGYTILMRGAGGKGVTYFSNLDRKTMLARALQQNLATWMNLATGKINGTAVVVIPLPDNPYEGSLIGALREAEDLILLGDDASLERAKNIADYINNNQFTDDSGDTESAIESSAEPLACGVYNDSDKGSTPSDKQPPKMKDMPKAPKHESPDEVQVIAPICTAGGNTYTVENTTNNPFYSVKFNFASGTEVKEGSADTFKYTLPTDVVAAMTNMQVEAKAATDSRIYDLACDFTSPLGCGEPVLDELYAVSFDGALDNGDGTTTLTFTVYVKGQHGLSHVAFSLPEGQTAGGVDANYTTEICE
jgi:hypothetical protein